MQDAGLATKYELVPWSQKGESAVRIGRGVLTYSMLDTPIQRRHACQTRCRAMGH